MVLFVTVGYYFFYTRSVPQAEDQSQGQVLFGESPGTTSESTQSTPEESINRSDSDHDGLKEYLERKYGFDPNKADWGIGEPDSDKDRIPDSQERVLFTDPKNRDTDSDGVPDYIEVVRGFNPLDQSDFGPSKTFDTDGDGLNDEDEAQYGTDPENKDTDGDSYADGDEVAHGYNPLGSGKLR